MADACRSCSAPVLWARHARTGKLAPLDAEPHPAGTAVVVDATAPGGPVYAIDSSSPNPRHMLHFVTCPNAKQHRR